MLRLRLNPNLRLRLTVLRAIELDPDGVVFNVDRYRAYIQMHQQALGRQGAMLKSLIMVDSLLVLVVTGTSFSIPGFGISPSEIPGALEVLVILSALSFMFLCVAFTNAQLYQAIVDVMGRAQVPDHLDPEFFVASDVFNELFLKATRAKMNLSSADYFEVGWGFRAFYGSALALVMLTTVGVVALHVGFALYAAWPWPEADGVHLVIFSVVALAHIAGLMIAAGPSFSAFGPPFTPPAHQEHGASAELDADATADESVAE
jgi:hypothetical protein